jgi:uncharacterized protein YuzE
MVRNKPVGFELSISGRDDGSLEAVYVRLRAGKVARTVEIVQDVLLADYDRNDNLLGLEILGPVNLSALAAQIEKPVREPFRRFIKRSAPKELVRSSR